MRKLELPSVVALLVLINAVAPTEAGKPIKGGYPSQILWQKTGRGQDARFVLHELPDVRFLFCDRETLKDRMRRSVCVVDDVRTTLGREPDAAKEVEIDKAITVGDLLKKIGFEKRKGVQWKGGQPQMRVIKRDAIIQSPRPSDTATGDLNVEAFLNEKLAPGDFLVIATIT